MMIAIRRGPVITLAFVLMLPFSAWAAVTSCACNSSPDEFWCVHSRKSSDGTAAVSTFEKTSRVES